MEKVGTYQESFDDAIDTLAGMLERRDALENQFYSSKVPMVVEHTNKAGATNLEQNPMIRMLNDMNNDILSYFRDLGLTPRGLKSITDKNTVKEIKSPFVEILDKLGV